MSKLSNIKKSYQPTRVEVAKTVIIAVLITAMIAFAAGVSYAEHNTTIEVINEIVEDTSKK